MRKVVRFTSGFGCIEALLRRVKESTRIRHRLLAAVMAVETAWAICWADLFQHGIKVSMPAGACGFSNDRKIEWFFESCGCEA